MRRLLAFIPHLIVFFACLPTNTLQAQESHLLGYCTDDLTQAAQVGLNAEVRLSGAIRLPQSVMQRYKGGEVTRIRVAMGNGVDKPSVWLRTSLTENSKVTQSIPQVVDGWNEVVLNRPLAIDGSELYVGFTYTQTPGVKGVYVQGEGTPNTTLLAIDNEWDDYHDQGFGILCIQAVVEADLPARDLGIIALTCDSAFYHKDGEMTATATIENLGTGTITGYTIGWAIDGTAATADATTYGPLEPGQTRQVQRTFDMAGLGEGAHGVQLTIHPEGGADEKADNDTFDTDFYTYAATYPRKVLLEHFTSLPCVNCPPIDKMLEAVVESRDDVAWVAHHVGYRNDEFTLAASEPYIKFGVTGNPYLILDRYPIIGQTPAFIVSMSSPEELNACFDEVARRPAFVCLEATLTASDNLLTATVSGEARNFFQGLYPRATVNAFVIEDDVVAEATQAGDSNKRQHDNVLRAVLTRQTGDLPQWTDDTHFTTTFSVEASEQWNAENLRLVAFVTAATDRRSGYPTGEVLNTTEARAQQSDGIATAVAPGHATRYYTIDGRPATSTATPGIYIIADGQGTRKVVVR